MFNGQGVVHNHQRVMRMLDDMMASGPGDIQRTKKASKKCSGTHEHLHLHIYGASQVTIVPGDVTRLVIIEASERKEEKNDSDD